MPTKGYQQAHCAKLGVHAALLILLMGTLSACTAPTSTDAVSACQNEAFATFWTLPSSVSGGTRIITGANESSIPGGDVWLGYDGERDLTSSTTWILAAGMNASGSTLVAMDRRTCRIRTSTTQPRWFQALTSDGDRVVATTTQGSKASIVRMSAGGVVDGEEPLGEALTSQIIVAGDSYIVLAATLDEAPRPKVYMVSRSNLKLERVIDLGRTNLMVFSGVVDGSTLYYPVTADENGEKDLLGLVDLRTGEQSEIDLGSRSPFLLRRVGEYLFVGHTSMTPAFAPLDSYRHISRVNVKTREVVGLDLDHGIVQLEQLNHSLAVVLMDSSGRPAELREYDPESLALKRHILLPAAKPGEMFGGILPLR
ncbi:hypothetical protein [Propioniciclava tarda]|uniref:Uncharacterized protein n=1 Tax=Propioniciclava tarda TaxID=433330 RepID=A0A4Q9KPH8_PROTD|nr:hypothetical protein [Propioniciclava tarda]TBT96245.1 hypothetical protein ET996_00820 [Propioniciclava tarda]SMO34266.1 hypothetical protein SAMN06266982_101166 [Propioniciclava tarda]